MRAFCAAGLALLMILLCICSIVARRSPKTMARDVSLLLLSLLVPILGNMVIILSSEPLWALMGCYTYYIGMDIMSYALLVFTFDYCGFRAADKRLVWLARSLLIVDVVQLLLNPFFGHAFTTHPIMVDDMPYYRLVPLLGQTFHRVVVYGLFLAAVVVFAYKSVRSPRIYGERYTTILLVMFAGGLWQSFYIFSGTPVDRSMIGFGIFGLLVFYVSLYYRPLRLLDRMLANIVSDMNEAIYFFDREGECIYANMAGFELVGVDANTVSEAPVLLASLLGDIPLEKDTEWTMQRHTGQEDDRHFFQLEYRSVSDDRGRAVGSFLSVRDRTTEEVERRRETYLARHDHLTGLYNKEYLYESARAMLDSNPHADFVVVGIDVKDFKIVNDIFSSDFGDTTLRAIGEWIRATVGDDALCGRLTGDKFGIVTRASDFDDASINDSLNHFAVTDGENNQSILLHLGVYAVKERDIDVSVMFDRAFLALDTIKNDYQVHIAYYGDAMRDEVVWGQAISAQLSGAIAQRQMVPFLQPIVDAAGMVVGAEVLVRWIHPTEGFLPPGRFIPVFEKNGMIAELDVYMWRCACELLSEWQNQGIDLFLSVNISPKDFYFMNVFEVIRGMASEYGIDPRKLRLEITESVVMTDLEKRLNILDNLRRCGFLVEMDDFGSGYSSLNLLKDMPVDVLKIDMMFLYGSKDRRRAETILQTIVDLSRNLGIPSLTEGVETMDQLSMLRKMGCDLYQGYYFAKPMSVSDFEQAYKVA